MDICEAIPEHLEPIVAGARARGVADAFELLGMDAILIDRRGRVLHSGANVARLMAPAAEIIEGRLVGCDPEADRVLQKLVAWAVAPGSGFDRITETIVDPQDGTPLLRLRAIHYSAVENDRYQLLSAILIVTRNAA